MHSGCIGETSAFLLIIGGLYLLMRRVITPTIPFAFVGTVALSSLVSGGKVSVAIFGGGLMLGAIFMATDYTTTPTTKYGKLIFGIGCGLITFLIRKFTSLPEGVAIAILIMNGLTPFIDILTCKKPFGYIKPVTLSEEKDQE
jgi:electron transport complex protein RnfD